MSPEHFIKAAKAQNTTLAVIQVTVLTGQTELKGSGVLEFTPGCFTLRFACQEGEPPELPKILHREQFWAITGRFVTGLSFRCSHVPPPSSWRGWQLPKECAFTLESIDLEADGFDQLTYDEFEEILRRNDASERGPAREGPGEIRRVRIRHTGVFHILIADYPLLFGNEEIRHITKHPFCGETNTGGGRILQGTVGKFEYCLSEAKQDLSIDVRSKNGEVTDESEDKQFVEALLDTVSFTHGQQIRRFHSQYWRDHKLVENGFRPIQPTVRTSNIPFPERLCIAGAVKQVQFDFSSAFQHVLKFFLSSDFSHSEIRDYLSELRLTSVKGMNPSHARLAVCRIFEGVVDILFDELKLQKPKASPDISSFENAKASTCRWLSKKKRPGFKRLHSVVQNARPLTTKQKYHSLVRHYSFNPEGIVKQILADWNERRHPLAHGRSDSGESNAENMKAWFAQSRIAGGINMLVLKRSGYTGRMRISHLENTYVDI